MFSRLVGSAVLMAFGFVMFASVGCNKPAESDDKRQAKNKEEKKKKEEEKKTDNGNKKDIPNEKHSDDGWWCGPHGIPEDICSLCSEEFAAKAKKEKDWCQIHERALSQCFKCDPSKYAKFEAMYENKYGKKPKRPPESEFKK